MTITATNTAAALPVATGKANQLGTTDFLRLMTEQLKAQDPFSPQDNSQMVAQMAQMSASSGIADINITLGRISEQLTAQTALLNSLRPAQES